MKHWSMSSQLKALRSEVGLPSYGHIPMRIVPDDLFADTLTYSHEGWPDLAATDIADWPGSLKSLDGSRNALLSRSVVQTLQMGTHRSA